MTGGKKYTFRLKNKGEEATNEQKWLKGVKCKTKLNQNNKKYLVKILSQK